MGLKAIKYENDHGFENYDVVQKCSLNFFDVSANSNKFYTIEVHQNGSKIRVFTDYGRVGSSSTKQVRIANDLSQATIEFESIKRSKEKKGYVLIELAQSTTGSSKAQELIDVTKIKDITPKKKTRKKVSKLSKEVQKFVLQIFDEAGKKLNTLVKGSANSDGASPLGKLSVAQLNKGRVILQEIADEINYNKKTSIGNSILSLSNEYYRQIPKSWGRNVTPNMIAIKTLDEVNEQMDILNFYEGALSMGNIMFDDSDIDKKYESLKSDIGVLDPNSDKYKQIVNYVTSTESKHHSVHLDVQRIFTVNQKNAPKFDESFGNVKELFHGTRTANMVSILSSSLRLPNQLKGVYITGAMFGPGLYFADQSTKSSQYSCSKFGGSVNQYDTSFMFLCDVSLGKEHVVQNSHYFYNPPTGYSSVKGEMGRNLLHNEYIVYQNTQQAIRYIIEFKSRRRR